MSPEIKTATETDNRDRLEADADALLSRLARTLESLDRRRHDAFNPKVQVVRHPLISALLGGSLVVLASGASLLGVYLFRHRKQQLAAEHLRDRVRALTRAWFHPERVARPTGRPIAKELARGVVISVGTYVVSKLAERALVKLFPKLQPETATATATAGAKL